MMTSNDDIRDTWGMESEALRELLFLYHGHPIERADANLHCSTCDINFKTDSVLTIAVRISYRPRPGRPGNVGRPRRRPET